jgi:proteasome lid subunit RPN8/RPN11
MAICATIDVAVWCIQNMKTWPSEPDSMIGANIALYYTLTLTRKTRFRRTRAFGMHI